MLSNPRPREFSRGAWRVTSGGRELLKWLALAAMVADHVNRVLLASAVPTLSYIGRVAFPIFGLVLAYNVSHAGAARRALPKLLAAGVMAQPFTMCVRDAFQLNVMFTLALGLWLATPSLMRDRRLEQAIGVLVAICAGVWCEFAWFGIAYVFTCARWCEHRTEGWAVLWSLSLAALVFVNGNFWALAALVPLVLASWWTRAVPRGRWFFYVFYPAHFAVLALWVRIST